ncbi:MAG TPA: potassium transporter TrkG [Thiobacillaceae bacterium]|nr:potassium transporter TrkG [Thiobacillaceae bacterium]
MRSRFLFVLSTLAVAGIGWATFSRFSQASKAGHALYQSKVFLRSIAAPETLTIGEHIMSAIGFPCLIAAMLWCMYMVLQDNPKIHSSFSKWAGAAYSKHFARVVVYFGLGMYLIHQFDKEVLEAATNRAFHFYWDVVGLGVTYLLLYPFFRPSNYARLHQCQG